MNKVIQNFKNKRGKLFVESQKETMDKFIKINKINKLENTDKSYLNEEYKNINLDEDNNISIGQDNNKIIQKNNNFDYQTQDNNFNSQTHDSNSNSQTHDTRMKLQNKMILILNNVSTKIKHELTLLSIEFFFKRN